MWNIPQDCLHRKMEGECFFTSSAGWSRVPKVCATNICVLSGEPTEESAVRHTWVEVAATALTEDGRQGMEGFQSTPPLTVTMQSLPLQVGNYMC